MLAQPRQIHHEGVFELAVNFLLHAFEIDVLRTLDELATQNLSQFGPHSIFSMRSPVISERGRAVGEAGAPGLSEGARNRR